MKQFEWTANYATGMREIDSQHAYLFALTNRLMRSAAQGAESISLEQAVNDLVSYADRHFSYEESVMEQAGYEHLAEHKLQHRRMRKQLDEFVRGLSNNSVTLNELTGFLQDWLTLHILREDMQYIPAVRNLIGDKS